MLYIHTAMIATIICLRVAAIRLAQNGQAHAPRIAGDLVIDDWIASNAIHRPIRVARLHPEGLFNFHPQLLHPLFDARVLPIARFIDGIENLVGGQQVREVAQPWMLSLS